LPGDLPADGDGSAEEVDVLDAKSEQLAHTQPKAGLSHHHRLVAPGHGGGQLLHLSDREGDDAVGFTPGESDADHG